MEGGPDQRSRRVDRPKAGHRDGGWAAATPVDSHRTGVAGSGAGGISESGRRAKDTGANPAHIENGQDPAKLRRGRSGTSTVKIIDHGGGTPIVVIPGAQGRWEWMKPAIDALARRCRVITFSLADEPTCGAPFDPHDGFSS